MDSRLQALTQWLHGIPGFEQAVITPVSGDASFRRYFRATTECGSWILMDAPPDKEDCRPFVAIARHWYPQGIAVPAVLHWQQAEGFMVLDDLGDQLLLPALNDASADTLYGKALQQLCQLQGSSDPADFPLPPYDEALLNREMALFPDWLLTKQLGLSLSNQELCLLETTFAFLRESALAQPQVAVHRDYHARNLLVRGAEEPLGIIDFQDAVRGPVTYDVVSLLKDCYIRWPEARISVWLEQFRQQSLASGLHRADSETFRQWFELMGMQRHLKAAGIFARLAIRDGKTGFLGDVPRTLGYLADAAARQPALRNFHGWLLERVMPALTNLPNPAGAKTP
ncbi:MAG: phosphotransferase [Marinobacter sp.]|nr:phosphotransferase [Marinobacter sp.]